MTSSETDPTAAVRDTMPGAYDPGAVEAVWYRRWLEADLFRADAHSLKPAFSIAIPPPNITGDLHLGHAVQAALQDAWARYRRMTGYEVLWLPGTDHAAIATQNVIEKQLAEEGTTKEELGRDAFNDRVAAWYRDVGGVIVSQLHELGASLDWSRLRFTLDDAYVKAVRTAFVHYYKHGLIYRGPRIVNWCPRCQSAISDLEVEWREHTDTLYTIRYRVEGSDESISIATVRPETMLFDTGVAVHPEDPRYRDLVGKTAILPLVGRRLPIVADPVVERDFGTGALKITPGHDPLDYELGERHGLQMINGLHPDGHLNAPSLPRYDGLTTLEARERVVEDLRMEEVLEGERPYTHEVGHCDRCGTVLEPLISEQWWLRMRELAARSLESSRRGEVRWHPERFQRSYEDWLRGVRDWCISRQLWLGHRIPVYTCGQGHRFASVDEPSTCSTCGGSELTQDPDVLDTWFSSALWPFATLGWPEDTPDLRKFYPTSINTTAREILPLWVARMIFSGLEFMEQVPFGDVMIHATILAADGRRMSKSLGTGVDPRQLIRTYGADALRAWASQVVMTGQDVRYDESRIEGYRRFANKLWNATKLVTQRLPEGPAPALPAREQLTLTDRWILSRLAEVTVEVPARIEDFTFTGAITSLYDFCWHDFCDWYLEAVKTRLRAGDPVARGVAVHVLDVCFRLLHPFMPFLTEELSHRLPGERDFIMRRPWPAPDPDARDAAAEARLQAAIDATEEVRRLRKQAGARERGGRLWLGEGVDPEVAALLAAWAQVELQQGPPAEPALPLAAIVGHVELPAAQKDAASLHRERGRLENDLARTESKLGNPSFVDRAPQEVVQKERDRREEILQALSRLG